MGLVWGNFSAHPFATEASATEEKKTHKNCPNWVSAKKEKSRALLVLEGQGEKVKETSNVRKGKKGKREKKILNGRVGK